MTLPETTKPLFIPIATPHYEEFASGRKMHEYRPYGPRWNERTCRPGRAAVLSCGYGKQRRMTRTIVSAKVVSPPDVFVSIYGVHRECFAIELSAEGAA